MKDLDDNWGIRDADFETLRINEIGNIISHLHKKGICLHGHIGPHDKNKKDGKYICFSCGKTFDSRESALEISDELRMQYL